MPKVSDAFLAELGLQRADHAVHPWSDDPARKIQRAGLTHAVMSRMLESAEALAPFVKCDKAVVLGWLRDLVLEESERSPFGLVEILSNLLDWGLPRVVRPRPNPKRPHPDRSRGASRSDSRWKQGHHQKLMISP